MSSVSMWMKDGSRRDFPETSRAGGSWCTTIRYEGVFAIVTDAYGTETAISSQDIVEVVVSTPRGGW